MKDMNGSTFTEGCKVVRAVKCGTTPLLEICTVTKIEDGKLYLDDHKQPIKFHRRLLILEQDCVPGRSNLY